ncbi:Fc.00g057450.m01.CDS01 [Cosmosporella sp. VM-42]
MAMDPHRRRYRHGQPAQQQGQDEDPFAVPFSYMGASAEQGQGQFPNASYPATSNGFYSSAPGPTYGLGSGQQQQQPAFAGQESAAFVPWHRGRPPDKNALPIGLGQLADFNEDVDSIGSRRPQPNLANSQASPQSQAAYSPAHQQTYHFPASDPQSNPQRNPRADPWNPVALRTPPQAPQETFPNVGQSRAINPDFLSPYGFTQPSSTATTQPGYASPTTFTHTYSDGVSIQSDNRSQISEWSCPDCFTRLGDPRSLRRHQKERHGAEGPYVCACGKETIRYSNHTRHMKACMKKPHERSGRFTCRCNRQDNDHKRHLTHIKDCGKEKAGRRPRTADASGSYPRFCLV